MLSIKETQEWTQEQQDKILETKEFENIDTELQDELTRVLMAKELIADLNQVNDYYLFRFLKDLSPERYHELTQVKEEIDEKWFRKVPEFIDFKQKLIAKHHLSKGLLSAVLNNIIVRFIQENHEYLSRQKQIKEAEAAAAKRQEAPIEAEQK